jgi:hypothetical protein
MADFVVKRLYFRLLMIQKSFHIQRLAIQDDAAVVVNESY